jgi:hypothetical protein
MCLMRLLLSFTPVNLVLAPASASLLVVIAGQFTPRVRPQRNVPPPA